jgi:LPXTG-site transpeptidase (sortase) family protein
VGTWQHRGVAVAMRGRRALVVAIALLIAAQATAVGIALASEDDSSYSTGGALGEAAARSARPDGSGFATIGSQLIDATVEGGALRLPQPTLEPVDPYAPTPEVRVGHIEIPAIGVSEPLRSGVTLTSIDRGPSHWPGTALPGGLGNVVVAGHRTTWTQPFHDLDLLRPGDELVFTTAEGRFVYVLERTEVVTPDRVDIVDQRYQRTATLFACHPKGSAAFRIVGHFRFSGLRPAPIGVRGASARPAAL